MKGIICEEVERFKFSNELPEPVMKEGEAIVAIKRVGICGTDLHAFKGNQPFFSYPCILGHEIAGIVEQIGANQEGIQVGDQVIIIPYLHCGNCVACRNGRTNCCTDMKVLGVHVDGGMRERIAVPITNLLPTAGLTLDQSAVVEPFAIGAHAVRRSGLHAGETVLVIGGGPIGLGVMAFARSRGARVIAMDVNEERLTFCGEWAGAEVLVQALNDPLGDILAANGGELPTVVFDATGNQLSMTSAFQYVANGGRLVYVGLVKATIQFDDQEFHKREMTLMGSRNATHEDFMEVMKAIRSGSIDVGPYITHRVSFENMIHTFEEWLDPTNKVIKAIVEI